MTDKQEIDILIKDVKSNCRFSIPNSFWFLQATRTTTGRKKLMFVSQYPGQNCDGKEQYILHVQIWSYSAWCYSAAELLSDVCWEIFAYDNVICRNLFLYSWHINPWHITHLYLSRVLYMLVSRSVPLMLCKSAFLVPIYRLFMDHLMSPLMSILFFPFLKLWAIIWLTILTQFLNESEQVFISLQVKSHL